MLYIILFLLWILTGLVCFAISWSLNYIKIAKNKLLVYTILGPLSLPILLHHNMYDEYRSGSYIILFLVCSISLLSSCGNGARSSYDDSFVIYSNKFIINADSSIAILKDDSTCIYERALSQGDGIRYYLVH